MAKGFSVKVQAPPTQHLMFTGRAIKLGRDGYAVDQKLSKEIVRGVEKWWRAWHREVLATPGATMTSAAEDFAHDTDCYEFGTPACRIPEEVFEKIGELWPEDRD